MPYFPGQWFPKKDANGNYLFEASILALLKPWFSISDLKREGETFLEAFDDFIAHASKETTRTIENLQFYHECSEGTQAKQSEPGEVMGVAGTTSHEHAEDVDLPAIDCDLEGGANNNLLT
jgi:hypothetical protein